MLEGFLYVRNLVILIMKCKGCMWSKAITSKRILCFFPKCPLENRDSSTNENKTTLLTPWLPKGKLDQYKKEH